MHSQHDPQCSRAQLDDAIEAAQRAFPAWAALGQEERKTMMLNGAGKVKTMLEPIAEVLTMEQGKPLSSARGELKGVVGYVSSFI